MADQEKILNEVHRVNINMDLVTEIETDIIGNGLNEDVVKNHLGKEKRAGIYARISDWMHFENGKK